MGILGKNKKKKETEKELKARLAELQGEGEEEEDAEEEPEEEIEEEPEELPQGTKKNIKKAKGIKPKEEPKGGFTLDDGEMDLAIDALLGSEELKVYQQVMVGQKIAKIIGGYNEVVREKNGEEEGKLPTE